MERDDKPYIQLLITEDQLLAEARKNGRPITREDARDILGRAFRVANASVRGDLAVLSYRAATGLYPYERKKV